MNTLAYARSAYHRLLVALGLRKAYVPYVPDINLADTINRIVNASPSDAAFIVAVETRQAMIQILSYAEKNGMAAVAVGYHELDTGRFPSLLFKYALQRMAEEPARYRVVVVFKNTAVVGWTVPEAFQVYWKSIHMLTTFNPPSLEWKTQFFRRLRRHPIVRHTEGVN